MKPTSIFIVVFVFVQAVIANKLFAQSNENKFSKDGKFGFSIGINNNSFVRNEKIEWNSVTKTFSPGINTGLHFRPYFWHGISSYVQIAFSQKGATETFNIQKLEEQIAVRTNLAYGQFELEPLEITPFPKKNMSPYLAVGFFYSKMLSSKLRYQYAQKFDIEDDINHFILDFSPQEKSDQGIAFIGGFRFQNFRLEVRNEFGTKALYLNSSIKNHVNSVILRYSL